MTTTPSPLTTATMLCAEYREHWCKQPGNQRPPIHDHAASMDWWTRWMGSKEKAHCDMLLSEALKVVLAPTTLANRENAVAGRF